MSSKIAGTVVSMDTIQSVNPATLEVLGKVRISSKDEVHKAVALARTVQPEWEALGFAGRREFILKARDAILADIDAIALLISQENGKPILEAMGNDIMPALDLMTYFAKKSQKLLRNEKIRLGKWSLLGHQSHLEFYPVGVVGVISPWNFPFSIPLGELVMALMVGNTVVLKPSEYTPLVGEKIGEIFSKTGLPRGVLQIVQGTGMTGAELVAASVNKIAFTGSVATGKKIMAAAAQNLTPVTLELGGKDPMIICADADLDVASSAAVWGAFCNSGQVCASVERVYVHESIADDFIHRVVEKTRLLRQGVGQTADIDVGSMTAEMQIKKVEQQIEEAKARGAQILTGGKRRTDLKGYFYEPTVLVGVDHSFTCVKDETFGPTLPIMTFTSESEAVKKANDSEYALNAYIWSKNLPRARTLASKIVAGTVNINDSLFTHALPQTPWGGPKSSGMGRTHGALGLLDLVEVRHVHVNKSPIKKNFFWWYGYSEDKITMLRTLCRVLFGRGLGRASALVKFVRLSLKAKVN